MFNSAATATQLYLEIHLCQCPIWYIFHCCNKKLLLYIGNTPYSCAIKYPFCVFVHRHVTPYPAVALARPPKWGKIIPFSVDILEKLVKSCINYWKITILYWCIVTLFLYMCIFMVVFVVVCVFAQGMHKHSYSIPGMFWYICCFLNVYHIAKTECVLPLPIHSKAWI